MIAAALAGDLAAFRGLPPGETRERLEADLAPVAAVGGPVEAERPRERFDVLTFERAVAPTPVEAWFRVGSAGASLLEYDDPPIPDVDALLAALGEPEHEETRRRHVAGMFVIERVYASRGLTLSVATPFDEDDESPRPGTRQIVHVQLYEPTTPELWVGRIGAGLPPRPFPPG